MTNIRAAGKDDQIKLTPVKPMSLEQVISFINPDEMIEVTPSTIRIRKQILDSSKRKSARKATDFIIE
jgi:GTP-binding protein